MGSLQTLPPSLAEAVRSPVELAQDANTKVPAGGTEETCRPISVQQNTTRVAVLTAIQHITKPLLPPPITTSASATMVELDGARKARGQAVPSAQMK